MRKVRTMNTSKLVADHWAIRAEIVALAQSCAMFFGVRSRKRENPQTECSCRKNP
jgi:hypothetical protein